MQTVLAQVADCEARAGGWLAQDVNAWSSLAYVAVGLGIGAISRHRRSMAFVAFGAIVVLVGTGSLLFHGTDTGSARLLHDVPLVALLGAIAGWQIARTTAVMPPAPEPHPVGDAGNMTLPGDVTAGRGLLVGLAVGVVGGALLAAMPTVAINAGVGFAAVAALIAEWATRRRGMPAVWTPLPAALLAAGVVMWVLGTSGSPVCDEGSVLQPHAAWHVLSALAILAWARRAMSTTNGTHQ